MTRVLSDGSEEVLELAGEPRGWDRLPAADLPHADRELWDALGSGDPAWVLESNRWGESWSRIVIVAEAAASQFDALRDLGRSGHRFDDPVACVALTGRDFHGHRGRPWAAVPGNLHLSVALAPSIPVERLGLGMTMLPAVATMDAIRAATDGAIEPGVKWVNDVLIEGRKVAGVLTTTQITGQRMDLAVLGVGLNVGRAPVVPPTPFAPRIGCLNETAGGEDLTLGRILEEVLEALATRYESLLTEGPDPLYRAYRDASVVIGRRVRIWEEGLDQGTHAGSLPPPLAEGVVRDVLPDLSLRLDGRPEPLSRGRLALVDPPGIRG